MSAQSRTWLAGSIATVTLLLSAVGAGSASAATAPAPLNYVALGDSYTADWGVQPVAADEPSTGCVQSANDYPHQVAANLGLSLHDVSCAGALTTNMTTPQTTFAGGVTGPAAPPQFNALTASTAVVTIGIGGNDFDFSAVASVCAVSPISGYVYGTSDFPPYYDNCKAIYDPDGTPEHDALRQRILQTVGPAVQNVVTAIHDHSPLAQVFFVDYLAIAPTQATAPDPATYPQSCYRSLLNDNAFPFTAVDTPYLADTEALLNSTLDAAATAAGATVVSPYAASLPHSACAGTADPWVNGITVDLTRTATPTTRASLGASIRVGSLHPNLEGAVFQSENVTHALVQTLGLPDPTTVPPVDGGVAPNPSVGGATPTGGSSPVTAVPELAATGPRFPAVPVTGGAAGLVAAGLLLTWAGRRRVSNAP